MIEPNAVTDFCYVHSFRLSNAEFGLKSKTLRPLPSKHKRNVYVSSRQEDLMVI